MIVWTGLPSQMCAYPDPLPQGRSCSGLCSRKHACDERSGRLYCKLRLGGYLASLVAAGILLVFMVSNVHAASCNDAKANELFVDAAKEVGEAKNYPNDQKLKSYKKAVGYLDCITREYKCSSIAVKLASGQSIGDISIQKLKMQIKILDILENKVPSGCYCSPLLDALNSALDENDEHAHNISIETIARKMVRRDAFVCAKSIVDLIIGDDKKQHRLRRHITRAQIRVDLR